MHKTRIADLRARMAKAGLEAALITDQDAVYYLCGYYDYLHMEFGRPTILVIPAEGEVLLITPSLDAAMAEAHAVVDRIAPWNDGVGEEWRAELPAALRGRAHVGIEPNYMPPPVRAYAETCAQQLGDVTPLLSQMRMVKSPEELQLDRHAGQVGMAMME